MSEDPIGEGPNHYRYAGNDPVNFYDPTGLSQAGNPLNALAGGYSGGKVAPAPKINPNLLNSPTFNTVNIGGYNYNSGPARSGSSLSGLGNIARSVTTSATRSFNPVVTTVVNAGLGIGAASFAAIPPVRSGNAGRNTSPQLIREIAPGRPIVPQQIGDVPGVRSAIENPNRYITTNHSNNGNFVVDTQGEGVRFVTGDNYLPIDERYQRAGQQAREAAGQARFLSGVQEALVTISPIHETGRDVSAVLTGRDYLVDSNVRYTTQDRVNAAGYLFIPGGNSGQVRYADEALDGLRIRGRDLGQQQGREFRVEQLQIYEFDANQPKHVRGYLQNERRRIAGSGGGPDVPRTPQGYEQAHGRNTPAREGYDYSNSRLQGIDLNRLEERVRRNSGTE